MNKIFIIAEAGVNHNGDIQTAKELIDVAAAAEADAVKFQTFKADTLVCRQAPKAAYQMETTSAEESQFDMLKKLELTPDMHRELIDYCHEKISCFYRRRSIWTVCTILSIAVLQSSRFHPGRLLIIP